MTPTNSPSPQDGGPLLHFGALTSAKTVEQVERARTFRALALAVMGVVSTFLSLLIVLQPETLMRRAGTILAVALASGLLLWVNRTGRTLLATWLLLGALYVILTVRTYSGGGIAAPATTAYVILVLMAGLLLGRRGGILMAIASALAGLAMAFAETSNGLPESQLSYTPISLWLYLCMWLSLALILQQLVSAALQRTLMRAQSELHERSDAELRLRNAHESLAMSEELLRQMLKHTPAAVAMFDTQMRYLYATDRWITDYRLEAQEAIVGRSHYDVFPEVPERWRAVHRRALGGAVERCDEEAFERLDGKLDWLQWEVRPWYRADDQIGGVTMFTQIVTSRKQAEADRERLLFDLGERVKELQLLHKTARLFQRRHEEMATLLTEWVQLLPAAWRFPQLCEARVRCGDVVVATSNFRESPWRQSATFDTSMGRGSIEVVYLRAPPVGDAAAFLDEEQTLIDSLAELLTGYAELRTHQERLEGLVELRTRELSRAKEDADSANRAKSVFLANMSHEIRTPLNAILGYARLLKRETSLLPDQQRKVSTIVTSGDHLLTVLNNVLEMSKIEAGRTAIVREAFQLRRLLDQVESMFQGLCRSKGLRLSMTVDAGLPEVVLGDAPKIRQVLINLLGNAVKFTQHGTIDLGATSQALADGTQRIILEVTDTGPGIEPEQLSRIFDPFEQTKEGTRHGGAGLGLAISRDFARLMGGELSATSTPLVGSVFRFTFGIVPVAADDPANEAHSTIVRLSADQPPFRVLVVDDVSENRDALLELLDKVGFQTRGAASGEEALQVHQEWRSDLILMDIRMPGIGGIEAVRRLRSSGQQTPVLALTASSVGDTQQQVDEAGADAYMLKPYGEDELLNRVGQLLGARYVYDAMPRETPFSAPLVVGQVELVRSLRTVRPGMRLELREAALRARLGRIHQLLAQITPTSPDAARQIRQLTEDFRYQQLVAALDEANAEQS